MEVLEKREGEWNGEGHGVFWRKYEDRNRPRNENSKDSRCGIVADYSEAYYRRGRVMMVLGVC